jgi:hypothetical protein
MMTNSQLYGRDDVPRIPADICNTRIDMLHERLAIEVEKHYMNQDNNLIFTLIKAIKHWQMLRDGEEEN